MNKKIKTKLHKFLFPEIHEEWDIAPRTINSLTSDKEQRDSTIRVLRHQINKLENDQEKEKAIPKPTLADLMRDSLGLEPIDFVNVVQSTDPTLAGLPKHFLATDDKAKRATYIAQLAQIFSLEVWHEMCKFHIDYQGNYSFRTALTDMEVFAGRMSVNGISLLRNDVKKGYDEYVEGRKPDEEFDEFETTEGVPIRKDN